MARPNPRAAQGLGVRVIHQERQIAPDLSVAENLVLDRVPAGRLGLGDNPVGVRCLVTGAGMPTVREAQFFSGQRMAKKRMPVVERRQETGTSMVGPPPAVADSWPDTGSFPARKGADVVR